MAYKVIFKSPGGMVEECVLDSVPDIGDDVTITHYDPEGEPTGWKATFPVLARRWDYEKHDRPSGSSLLDSHMYLTTVHVKLGPSTVWI